MASCKYYKQVRQVSYDSGVTWISLDEYQKGDLYETDSPDCGGGITQYKWVNVSGEYTCVGTTKYQKTKKQQSTDGGQTWVDVNPPEYSTGGVIEYNSSDCGGSSGYENQYLTLVARGSGAFRKTHHSGTFQYSKDNGSTWATATSATTIMVNNGDRVMFKGTLVPNSGVGIFSANTQFEAEGNPMSLLYGDNFIGQTSVSGKNTALGRLFQDCSGLTSVENLKLVATTLSYACYYNMFYGCSSLTTVPSGLLPSTTLASRCYANMFWECTSLTTVPQLPATTLAEGCYSNMFVSCSSLTTAPDLLATTLVEKCYEGMFYDCSSLNYVRCLATIISATECTYNWVFNVSSSGTFVKNSSMSGWPSGISGIPTNWTIQNA